MKARRYGGLFIGSPHAPLWAAQLADEIEACYARSMENVGNVNASIIRVVHRMVG
ncbi:hypothetical protein PWG15_07735 [Ensifer adhaerens]|uniref:hypothetical protein n=1 Tax=Ensifer adhaerens TaxID=106592 RepID=UPI0023AA178F|nr:hypothetical protein [Ensifer adhaerens]WDZ78364.1 hypothetical protein PWG15_07735 [Ensifer adhaerens]